MERRSLIRSVGATAFGLGGLGLVGSASADEGHVVRTECRTHPDIGGAVYQESVNVNDICYWADSSCLYIGISTTYVTKNIPSGAGVTIACEVTGAGCSFKSDVEKISGHDYDWVHVYSSTHSTKFKDGAILLIPEEG